MADIREALVKARVIVDQRKERCMTEETAEPFERLLAEIDAALSTPAAKREEGEELTEEDLAKMLWQKDPRGAAGYWGNFEKPYREKYHKEARAILSRLSAAPSDEAVRAATIEECASKLAEWYPDNANTNAFCAAIRSLSTSTQAAPGVSEELARKVYFDACGSLPIDAGIKAIAALSRQQPAAEAGASTPGQANLKAMRGERSGIYIASKVKHAERWLFLRNKLEYPIISTWIDEAGQGQSKDLGDLWRRCIVEAMTAKVFVINREIGETLKGAWIELGAALAAGTPVLAVGIEEFTVAHDTRIRHFPHIREAMAEAYRIANGRTANPAPSPVAHGNQDEHVEAGKLQLIATSFHTPPQIPEG